MNAMNKEEQSKVWFITGVSRVLDGSWRRPPLSKAILSSARSQPAE
jgi:hypothetical protein